MNPSDFPGRKDLSSDASEVSPQGHRTAAPAAAPTPSERRKSLRELVMPISLQLFFEQSLLKSSLTKRLLQNEVPRLSFERQPGVSFPQIFNSGGNSTLAAEMERLKMFSEHHFAAHRFAFQLLAPQYWWLTSVISNSPRAEGFRDLLSPQRGCRRNRESGNRIAGFGRGWLLLQAQNSAGGIKGQPRRSVQDPAPDMNYPRAGCLLTCAQNGFGQVVSVENVVAQNQGASRGTDKILYSRQHQRGKRVIDHGLVVIARAGALPMHTACVTGYRRVPDPPARNDALVLRAQWNLI